MGDAQWRPVAPGVQRLGVGLEELTPGARVGGVVSSGAVTVLQVKWHGSNAVTVYFVDDAGRSDRCLLYRDHEPSLWLEEPSRAYAFDGDPALFRLAGGGAGGHGRQLRLRAGGA